ncbi:MAG: ABC transporter ATP-binding protein [Bacillota bacterium]
MLKITDLNVSYGMVKAIQGVSLDVPDGKLVSIVGSNGAGKSTILQAISALIPISGGQIAFDGRRIDNLPAHEVVKLGVAHVPEGRILFNKLTVFENLQLGAHVRDYAKGEFEAVLDQVYAMFPVLKQRAKQKAGTLSGGEQQMVAIARGLMLKPKLLMLDEPSLGLMPSLVSQIFETLDAIRKQGLTVLLVEQNVQESLELADYAYVLQTGRIVVQGTGPELLQQDLVRSAYLGM